MKLEHQVCTLEQAKRLKELGLMQGVALYCFEMGSGKLTSNIPFGDYVDAFNVAELGVILTSYSYNGSAFYNNYYGAEGKKWAHNWKSNIGWYNTEAEVRAAG